MAISDPLHIESDRKISGDDFHCLVFRTSLQNQKDVEKISDVLNNMKSIISWHVDLDDWEKVLRIVCTELSARTIKDTLAKKGITAEELPL